jgi:hypothetical protein
MRGSSFELWAVLRTPAPLSVAGSLREAVKAVAPNLPITDVRTVQDVVGATLSERRLGLVTVGLLGGLALVLAAVGVFAVMSYGALSDCAKDRGPRRFCRDCVARARGADQPRAAWLGP